MTEQEKAIINSIECIIKNSLSTARHEECYTNDIFSKRFIGYMENIIKNVGEPVEIFVLALVGTKTQCFESSFTSD